MLINKAMIEIPPKFAGRPPVNPGSAGIRAGESKGHATAAGDSPAKMLALPGMWRGAQGLAADVRYYGQWMRDEAEQRIGHLYLKIEITAAMAAGSAPGSAGFPAGEHRKTRRQGCRRSQGPSSHAARTSGA